MIEGAHRNLISIGQTLLAYTGDHSDANVRAPAVAGPELLIATRSDRIWRAAGAAARNRIQIVLSPQQRMRRKLTTSCGQRPFWQARWTI